MLNRVENSHPELGAKTLTHYLVIMCVPGLVENKSCFLSQLHLTCLILLGI